MMFFKKIIKDQIDLLGFRSFKPDIKTYGKYYLLFGLVTAWLAGMGRYWDNPKADLWQYLGLGSVLYCFFLSGLLFLLLYPLKPKNWTYLNVLIFVSMTSLPAILYAIPVERYTTMDTAQMINVWFLAIVALWRVILLILFLYRSAQLSKAQIVVGAFLPITIIVVALTALNLEHVVFNIMAGNDPSDVSANDGAYTILFLITFFSMGLLPFLLIGYLWFVYLAWKKPLQSNSAS